MPDNSRIPIILLTGFLGAGKTTLLRRLLSGKTLEHTAFIVNEVGAVGLDQDLLKQNNSTEPVLLSGGCICCEMRKDLGYTLRNLYLQRQEGTVPQFERLVVETTGLANPGPIMHSLMGDAWLMKRFDLCNTVTIVDAFNGIDTLDTHPEALEQVIMADTLLISKMDIAPAENARMLADRLSEINPAASVRYVDDSIVAEVLNPRHRGLAFTKVRHLRALNPRLHDREDEMVGNTAVLELEAPVRWSEVAEAFDQVMAAHSGALLRIKGILNIEGLRGPVLVNAVQGSFHPPEMLERWPGDDQCGKVVFITRGTRASTVLEDFEIYYRRTRHP